MRNLSLLPLAALALTLGACGGTENRGLESVHQPVVSRTDYVFDINDGMGAQASQRLSGWFDSLRVGYGDRISIDDPSGNPSNRIAVAAAANRYGLMVQDTAPVTDGAVGPGMFRVVVSRSTGWANRRPTAIPSTGRPFGDRSLRCSTAAWSNTHGWARSM